MLATQYLPFHMASTREQAHHASLEALPHHFRAASEASRKYDARGLTYAQHELLRQRKTPHGIVLEESEVAPWDKYAHLPASKYVLLSRSPQTYRPPAESKPRYDMHNTFLNPVAGAGITFGNRQEFGLDERPPAWDMHGGVDSALYQSTPVCGPRFYPYAGSHVPTVLPATFNFNAGPTASASQQSYGPYWPDGTFSPYRPAPVRDSRLFDRDNNLEHLHSGTSQDSRTLRRSGRLLPSQQLYGGLQERSRFSTHHSQFLGHDMIDAHIYQAKSNSWSFPFNSESKDNRRSDLELGEPANSGGSNKVPSMVNMAGIRLSQVSDQIAFRDRTFTWAHKVYVELLAKVQRESRIARSSGLSGHRRSHSKPSIYPRPPQRTGSHFADQHFMNTNGKQVEAPAFTHSEASSLSERSHVNVRTTRRRGSENEAPSISPCHGALQSNGINSKCGTARRGSDPPLHYTNHSTPASHLNLAASALETMELLCREAYSPWTDGILLAGCLAYGLGQYSRALLWYQQILGRDSNHVEARSNAAATLLALNRRDEALQYWFTTVKLRPSYFEAVEHLVGLLCGTQRAREAVDIIEFVEESLRLAAPGTPPLTNDNGEESDTHSRSSSANTAASCDTILYDYELDRRPSDVSAVSSEQAAGFGSSGYAIPGADNGRLLALIHAKGNMLYALGDNVGAALSFEDAILIATGRRSDGMKGLILQILQSCVSPIDHRNQWLLQENSKQPILLSPDQAQQIANRMFPPTGELPGLEHVQAGLARKAAVATTSNSLLSLAKIYQDGLGNPTLNIRRRSNGTREILALYYLSLSLQRSPSTANNVGILLASVQQSANVQNFPLQPDHEYTKYPGIIPGSGIDLALRYYNYGLMIDARHAHLYTNLGSLLKDLGQLGAAIKMYSKAVECDPKFDIALANLANAVKDQGRIADAINYYRRAVQANPDFAEAVCGLATALNSVCNWYGRGGVYADGGNRDRIHVDDYGMMHDARNGSGWMNRVVEIVEKQLRDGESWGAGTLSSTTIEQLCDQLTLVTDEAAGSTHARLYNKIRVSLTRWAGKKWEGSRTVRLIERAIRHIGWQWYQDRYKHGKLHPAKRYTRPTLPATLSAPTAPTVLPFHTFTTPLSARQVRQISQRNAIRISVSTLRSPWLPQTVYPPPRPPAPCLRVGYVSSDFNNHPLAHLMQSVFGFHNPRSVRAYCYATTNSDNSIHRKQIESEAPVFHDASSWAVDKLVNQIVEDGIHILINLNGYTRGARNEVFAARPAPIHMSFMGFAGTLGAEWCDYVFADSISVPQTTLSPWRSNISIEDRLHPNALVEDEEDWIYAENIIFAKSTFFCVDHKQSSPDAKLGPFPLRDRHLLEAAWRAEQERRWKMRKELFPHLSDTAVVLGNFNQLYKIDPSTFRLYLRILAGVPNAVLWLLRFPDVGEENLLTFAKEWAGPEVASRIIFTDVAPKEQHILRASVLDLFLDTPECNAHTTAADVIWSGTPIVTWARWEYKMCSRMASSIVASALPDGEHGDKARADLLVNSESEYEEHAIRLATDLRYSDSRGGVGRGRLLDLRRMLWEGRWTSKLFDTRRWVSDLETAYWKAWQNWEKGEGGDIWL